MVSYFFEVVLPILFAVVPGPVAIAILVLRGPRLLNDPHPKVIRVRTPEAREVDRLVADPAVPLVEVVQAAELVAICENRSKSRPSAIIITGR